jgi:hypothetical protein
MTSFKAHTPREVAFVITNTLDKAGISAVLSGKGAAMIYAPDAFPETAKDLLLSFSVSKSAESMMQFLGFSGTPTSGLYLHPDLSYPVELTIGLPAAWNTIRQNKVDLKIVKPIFCVRERMQAATIGKNAEAARQAAAIALSQSVSIEAIRESFLHDGDALALKLFEAHYNVLKRRNIR